MSIIKTLRERAQPLNVAELAKLLLVTEGTIQKWARLKQIPCIRVGDTIRIDPGMLADWIEVQANCTCPPCAPSNPEDYLHWQDLEELVPKESVRKPCVTQQREATITEEQ
jgi:excisionase family DNA binding protein